jgi:uncharacterized protein (DUF1684 family)
MPSDTIPADYAAALESWRKTRLEKLKAADGWLNIIGRYWLEPGMVTIGRAENNDIVLAAGPARLGTLTQAADNSVSFTPADGSATVHIMPNEEHPPRFMVGPLLLEITSINGDNALRVRDTQSAEPAKLKDIPCFPAKPEWRIVADWVRLDAPEGKTINTTKNIETDVEVTHKAVFTHDGKRYALLATHGTADAPQFVIRDETAKDTTYPASRFVYGEDVTDKTIVLDFNKAINPPCSFTEHAVCPLPPPENILPFRIEAGEKRVPDQGRER